MQTPRPTPPQLKTYEGFNGCFVCGQSHRANVRLPQAEVMAAIDKLNQKLTSALVTVPDMAFIVEFNAMENNAADQGDNDTLA